LRDAWLGQLNAKTWRIDQQLIGGRIETGGGAPPPANWPMAQQSILGTITLLPNDVIEYGVPGVRVVATYRPTLEKAPGCD
jgi:hypothetical protein